MDYNPFKSGATQTVQEGELEMLKRNVNNPGQSDTAKKKMKDRIAQLQPKEAMDPVDKKALKGKHKDRKDKDIDNDGDVDGSDEYLHKRRKAISKADEGYYKDMEIKKQDKAMGAKPVPSKKKKEAKGGGKEGDVEMNPKMEKDSKSTPVEAKEDTNEDLQVYRVGHRSIGGNVHAKSEKDGIAQLRKKGVKGKITLTHRGPAPKPPKGMGESVDYHKKMSNSHTSHGDAHETEATNGGHDDHDYASVDHHEAAKAHDAAAAAHKKHGGDSSQYKSASAKAKSASKEAKEASENAGKFKKTAPPKPFGESKIRSALRSVLSEKSNRDDHYKSSTDPEMMKDKIKGKGAEDMMKGANDEISKGPDAHLDEPAMVNKDAKKMTSNVPSMKARKNDNMQGDKKVVPAGTPMKNPAAMKAESFGAQVSNISAAYAAMNTPIEEVEEKDAD